MSKTEDKKIDKWIDLSVLPRNKKGQISWQNSIGIKIPFRYGIDSGCVELIEYVGNHKYNILIHVGDNVIQYCLSSSLISGCNFGHAIKQPIGITHPELIKYFVNKDDAFKYPAYYTKSIDMACPICGHKKRQTCEHLTTGGFSCPRCSDGKSYAEKLMFNVLEQLNVKFINEVTKKDDGFEWVENYRYDFCISVNNTYILIEMDGHFHDGSKFYDYEKVRDVDINKDNLANINGFNVIRIDCRYTDICQRFEYIKNSICHSSLCNILNLGDVNWDIANEHALNSYIKLAADLFNSGVNSVEKIGEVLGVDRSTARGYLKIATEVGWCNYTIVNGKPLHKLKPIALFNKNELVGVFIGVSDLERKSYQMYGVHMDAKNIYAACNNINRHKRVRGYTPQYITYEEYEQLLPQFQTIQNECTNLQGVS